MTRLLYRLVLLFPFCIGTVCAQVALGTTPMEEEVITAQLDGYTISGLVSRMPGTKTYKYAIAQFPGYPSIMRLHVEDGRPVFELQGNTLVRGRNLWLDPDTLVLTVDAPSDQWGTFYHHFRRDSRYGRDMAALMKAVEQRYAVANWSFIGHSEGGISAYGAAAPNLNRVKHVVMLAPVFVPTKQGPGISGLDWDTFSGRLLWVHHADDPCKYTPYSAAVEHAQRTKSPLLTVRGGSEPSGEACRARSQHGIPGMEEQTFAAIQGWIKTGHVPASVGP